MSQGGKSHLQKINNWYKNGRRNGFVIRRNGTFRIENVATGIYQTQVSVFEDGAFPNLSPIARGTGEFTVPPIPGGVSDVPLKIPPLKLEMIKPAKSNNNPP